MNKKSLFSFSWPKAIFLAIVLIAFVASAMTVNTLSQMQPTLTVGGQDTAIQAQPFVKTAAFNMVRTDQGLATLTQKPITSQFASFAPAAAEVPEPYNFILVGVSIKGKGTLADRDGKNYLLKTVMVENQGGMGGLTSRLATTAQKTLKI